MRVLYLDIETAPVVADIWSLRDIHVAINQIKEHPRVIGVGYMWDGERRPRFISEYREGYSEMIERTHALLDEADVMCGYNSQGFDAKHLNAAFVEASLTPPSPYKHLDLYRIVKSNFRWPSYKLDYVAQRLELGAKLATGGHQLWVDCLTGDEDTRRKAWARMGRYCRQDVALLPLLREALTPWQGNAINAALWVDGNDPACQKCSSANLEKRGYAYTAQSAFPQYRCRDCGGWTRDTKASWRIQTAGSAR